MNARAIATGPIAGGSVAATAGSEAPAIANPSARAGVPAKGRAAFGPSLVRCSSVLVAGQRHVTEGVPVRERQPSKADERPATISRRTLLATAFRAGDATAVGARTLSSESCANEGGWEFQAPEYPRGQTPPARRQFKRKASGLLR